MRVEIRARLSVCYDQLLSRTLLRSLRPDDVPPRSFTISSFLEGDCLVYQVSCSVCSREDILTIGSILSELVQLSLLVRRVLAREILEG